MNKRVKGMAGQQKFSSKVTLLFKRTIEVLKIKGLLTECEGCTGKYLPEVFLQTERRRSEVCAKNRRQILSHTDRANEVNKTFIIWLLVHFLLSL